MKASNNWPYFVGGLGRLQSSESMAWDGERSLQGQHNGPRAIGRSRWWSRERVSTHTRLVLPEVAGMVETCVVEPLGSHKDVLMHEDRVHICNAKPP